MGRVHPAVAPGAGSRRQAVAVAASAVALAALIGGVRLAEPDPDERSRPAAAGADATPAATTTPSEPAPTAGVRGEVAGEERPPTATPDPVPTGYAADAVALVDAAATAFPSATIGVAVLDRVTGERGDGAAAGALQYSASIVKLLVAVDVLDQRYRGRELTEGDLALLRRALGPSDDAAMNALWSRFDGAGGVARTAQRLGLTATRPPDDPSQWGETVTSASDVVVVLEHVLDGMADEDEELLVAALTAAPATAADGFDQAFGLLAGGPSPDVAAKQGWMCCIGGEVQLHSAGVVGPDRRYVVALLTSQPRSTGYGGGRAAADVLAGAARSALR